MAVAGIQLSLQTTDLAELRRVVGNLFNNADKARILKDAIDKAIAPAFERLKAITPVGPTGNLKLAAAKKSVAYTRDGNAVGLIGYRRAGRQSSESAAGGTVRRGRDRAFHQWFLERGTQDRFVVQTAIKPYGRRGHLRRVRGRPAVEVRPHIVRRGQGSVIASSYDRLGPFRILPTARQPEGQRVSTEPSSPGAFFKKAKKGEIIRIPAMPEGGSSGRPPLQTAWQETQSTVAEILQRELGITIERALQTLTYSASGSINET